MRLGQILTPVLITMVAVPIAAKAHSGCVSGPGWYSCWNESHLGTPPRPYSPFPPFSNKFKWEIPPLYPSPFPYPPPLYAPPAIIFVPGIILRTRASS